MVAASVTPPPAAAVQYTLVASTTIPMGAAWPEARVVAVPPPVESFITVPPG